jgi:hypothetical protein
MAGRCLSRMVALIVVLQLGSLACGAAFNFQEPTDWTVGAPGSTFNNWEAAPDSTNYLPAKKFSVSNTTPSLSTVSPAITGVSNLNVLPYGLVGGSGGYYAFNELVEGEGYGIFANIYNHGGSTGVGTPYSSGYGTRVIFQTAATTNTSLNFSIFQDSVEFLNLDNSPFPVTRSPQLIGVTEIFRQGGVETPFGLAEQQELLFEYYLPEYSGDFRVRFRAAMHSSFQEFRVDTLLVEEAGIPGDFDGDDDVDADDLADWQTSYGIDGAADADDDNDSDGRDFLIWQRNYTGPQPIAAHSVPEPTSLMVVIFGIITGLTSRVGFSRAT